MWDEYLLPESIQEALEMLDSCKGHGRIIAGGTDLIPELKKGTRKVKCLVDISRISELKKIELDGDNVKIGAGVTHSEAVSSGLIREKATVLAEAAMAVGSPLIRNQGTLAGNVVNAQPAADTAVALFALDADVEIASRSGTRAVPIREVYRGIGKSGIDSTCEIVVALRFKSLANNQGSSFQRLAQRKALALPMLNTGVVLTISNSHFQDSRIVVAPIALMPFRSEKAEKALKGVPIGPEAISNAARAAASEAQPRDSALRGSAAYRKEMVKVLVRRAIERAILRAKQQ